MFAESTALLKLDNVAFAAPMFSFKVTALPGTTFEFSPASGLFDAGVIVVRKVILPFPVALVSAAFETA